MSQPDHDSTMTPEDLDAYLAPSRGSISVSAETYEALRVEANRRGIAIGKLVADLTHAYLDRVGVQ